MPAKTVAVVSKPQHVPALRSTWRKTREHYRAQLFRFLSIFGGLLIAQNINDFIANKPLFSGVTDRRALLSYLVGVGYVAWRQFRPSMTAGAVDSAPGATIVPAEVAPTANDAGHADAGGLLYLAIGLVVLLVILRVFHLI